MATTPTGVAPDNTLMNTLRSLGSGNIGAPIMLLAVLGMMILPIPPFLLDVFFSFNIALAIVVLLVCVYAGRPLDFSAFPTILLVSTLLRLALNVASTRVVLLEGHNGGAAAGKVIEAFGNVVIGGNYAVGLVVFTILMIINFIVVTKGAGRISEVSARFTLDAMPGKQMAIDADLNAGLIDQDEARRRRIDVSAEADFYGSMDGASKFVRGDAVAGILILFINILGGLGIGMAQHNLEFSDALQKYVLLTIGDGLVAQIPSLLLSNATAILVTRVNVSQDMGEQVAKQMFSSPKAPAVSAVILIIMGVIPGMPHIAFLSLAAIAGGLAYMIQQRNLKEDQAEYSAESRGVAPATASSGGVQLTGDSKERLLGHNNSDIGVEQAPLELSWDDVKPVDTIGLEVGYRLIPLVDKAQNGELLGRIKGIRKKLSQEMGFLVPSVHIRDNLDLLPTSYRIVLMGVNVAEGEIHPDRELAINPGHVFGKLDGVHVKDPAFGLDAVWIDDASKDKAQSLGYTVVDASTVVATHLNQILQKNVHDLLGHEEVQKVLDMLAKQSPKLAETLVPETVSMTVLLKVLKNLLSERVPIRDIRTIAETLATHGNQSQDSDALTAAVRVALARIIVQSIVGNEPEIPVITLDPEMEQMLLRSVQQSKEPGAISMEPNMAEKLQKALNDAAQRQEMAGKTPVLLVPAPLRTMLARFVRYCSSEIAVFAYNEIPDDKQITIEANIGGK